MKTEITLCKTQPKQSAKEIDAITYRIYRVRLLDGDEVTRQVDAYGEHKLYNWPTVWALECMFVVERDGKQANHVEWSTLSWDCSAEKAARYNADDYLRAQSLDPLYQAVRDYYAQLDAQQKIVQDLKYQLKQLQSDYQERYNTALKKRRLYSKAQRNEAPTTQIEALKKQFLTEYAQEKQVLNAQLNEARFYLEMLKDQ